MILRTSSWIVLPSAKKGAGPGEVVKRIDVLATAMSLGATIDDAIERLCFIAKIEEGLQQSRAGQVTSHEEVKKRYSA